MPSDVVVLRGLPIELSSTAGARFVTDCVRAAEGLLTDAELVKKYEIDAQDWLDITKNKELIRAIQDERERRVRNGTAARESAAQIFAKAGPTVLGTILNDVSASPRHRIESARELRQTAHGGVNADSSTNASEMFSIVINLGDTTERYEKEIAPMKPLLENKTDDNE
jgi:hypothetical protein